jgi:hypothetical protein
MEFLVRVTLLNILQVVAACSVVVVLVLPYLELGRRCSLTFWIPNLTSVSGANCIPILLLSLSPASPKAEPKI